jgi:hypothetical protein
MRVVRLAVLVALVLSGLSSRSTLAQQGAALPPGAYASNVRVVGYSDLDGRPGAFKMTILERGGRWYLYTGQFWHRGWTVLDVTDPTKPVVAKWIPGPDNTSTGQVDLADGKLITALERKAPDWGGDPTKRFDEGVVIWNLDDPANPKRLGQWKTGATGTHRNGYYGGRYVHLAAGMPGYRGNIYVILDISDPALPVEAGRWWVPGQHVAGGETPQPEVSLHGPAYVEGTLAWLPYGAAGMIVLDISDVAKPKLVSRLPFSPPFLGFIGVHSVLPLKNRGLAVVNSEAIQEGCNEPLNHASLVGIKDPSKPRVVAMFPLPVPPPGAPYKNFCDKGGRFGPHNQNQLYHNPHVQKSETLVYLTYFNAGLRIYDISDATLVREVGYFIPPEPTKRVGPMPKTKLVEQSEDVLVDTRGNIYLTHKQQGLWILQYTGDAGK